MLADWRTIPEDALSGKIKYEEKDLPTQEEIANMSESAKAELIMLLNSGVGIIKEGGAI